MPRSPNSRPSSNPCSSDAPVAPRHWTPLRGAVYTILNLLPGGQKAGGRRCCMDRVHYIPHRGKRVLLIDFSHSTPEEMQETLDEVERVISSEPPNSVLALSDFTDAHMDKAVADHMKVVATKDRPHVRRSAF